MVYDRPASAFLGGFFFTFQHLPAYPRRTAMKTFVTSIAFAFALSISPIAVNAQDRENPRDTAEDRRDAERNRRQQDRSNEAFERQQNTRLMMIEEMNAEFLARIDAAPQERLRFLLRVTQEFARKIEELYSMFVSEGWSQRDLDRRSKDLEKTSRQLRDIINFGTDPPVIRVAPLPHEDQVQRIRRLVIVSRRLIPNILFLVGGDAYDLTLLNQVRDDLALTEALSLALPQSRF